MSKIQERFYFLLVWLEAIGIVWARTRRTLRDLLDILVTVVGLLFNMETLKNKLCAILMVLCTLPLIFLEQDATATVFMLFFAVPMFFAKKDWIL